MSKEITTILWDMDNTLLDFEYSMVTSLGNCFQAFGETLTEDMLKRYEQINDSWWKRLERGEVTKADLLNGRFVDFFREYQMEHIDVEAFRGMYQEELGKNFSYIENSLEICAGLHRDKKQFVVTNGVKTTQYAKIKASGFRDVMDGVFISEELGYEKPRKEFFEQCMGLLEEKDPDRILIVGDSLSSDIRGGNNAGIKTCWFNPAGKKVGEAYADLRIDYEIRHLKQILEVIYG